MFFRFPARSLPGRVTTGAFILHSGIEKWNGPSEQAELSRHGGGRLPAPQVNPVGALSQATWPPAKL